MKMYIRGMSAAALVSLWMVVLTGCGGNGNASSESSSQTSELSSSVSSSTSSPSVSSASSESSSSSSRPSLEAWMDGASPQFDPVVIENGVTLRDTDGNILHAHGAGIIQVGDVYYWYGENRYEADQSFKSVRLYRSENLRDWTFVNDILTDQSDPDLNYAKIERPKIIYNKTTRQYVMWMHKEGGDNYGQARAAVAISDSIDGDYRYLGSFRPLNHMSRDCTAFVDDDGTAYFLSAANENADLHLYRLTSDYTQVASLVQKIWVGQHREAPALVKRNGVYFLMTSGTSGWDPNQARYGFASSLTGSWSSTQLIGNKTTFDSQPTFILTIDGTEDTSYLYLGDRWLDPKYPDSKYVWLPLTFPTNQSLAMDWSTRIAVDTVTGELKASGMEEVRLQSVHSGKCLDVSSESLEEHANVLLYGCDQKHNQRWRFTEVQDGFYQIKALHSSQCLDVASASTEDGANVLQWPCDHSENQLWSKSMNADGSFALISKHSGRCLDVEKWSTEDGGNIQQWECTGRENQQWVEN